MKLGKRLEQIRSMVASQYDHIWDCCCDHGLLGVALLSQQTAPHIHFVDIVAELMHQLENKLTRFFPTNAEENSGSQWQVHCNNVSKLQLQEFPGKHLIIISGVGGNLVSELVKAIYENNSGIDIDFLLCPVHHQYTLREQLIALDFSLKNEKLINDNNRYYEILLVSTNRSVGTKINPVGDLIWQTSTPEQSKTAADYLRQTLTHYRRVQLSEASNVQKVIDAYLAVSVH